MLALPDFRVAIDDDQFGAIETLAAIEGVTVETFIATFIHVQLERMLETEATVRGMSVPELVDHLVECRATGESGPDGDDDDDNDDRDQGDDAEAGATPEALLARAMARFGDAVIERFDFRALLADVTRPLDG